MDLSTEQVERYSRQIILEEVGAKGQEKLLEGSILLIGAGGLGSPAAYYLAAAGVGTIGIADFDRVEVNNLQRQIIHTTADVGRKKVDSAAEKIEALNPEVKVIRHETAVQASNIQELIAPYDFIIDGTDNFAAKFLINDACVMEKKPFSHAGILRFEGQAMTILPGQSSCYRCVFPEMPPEGAIPSCAQAGVLGVLAGTVGIFQATEAIKFLLETGELLTDSLLYYNAGDMSFRKKKIRKDPACPVCSSNPRITALEDERQAVCRTEGGQSCGC